MNILTKGNINNIELDWYADATYQSDGEVDFMFEPTEILFDMFFACDGTDSSKMLLPDEDDYLDAYTCSETKNGHTVFREIEFVYSPSTDDERLVFTYELSDEESALLTEKVKQQVEAKWYMSFEDMLKEARSMCDA